MYKIETPGRYLVKGEERLIVSDLKRYEAKEINGFKSPAHRMILTNMKTGEKKVMFPGEVIKEPIPRKRKKDAKS